LNHDHNDARVRSDAGCYGYTSPIRMMGDFANDTLRERWQPVLRSAPYIPVSLAVDIGPISESARSWRTSRRSSETTAFPRHLTGFTGKKEILDAFLRAEECCANEAEVGFIKLPMRDIASTID